MPVEAVPMIVSVSVLAAGPMVRGPLPVSHTPPMVADVMRVAGLW